MEVTENLLCMYVYTYLSACISFQAETSYGLETAIRCQILPPQKSVQKICNRNTGQAQEEASNQNKSKNFDDSGSKNAY